MPIDDSLFYVRDLMTTDGTAWNKDLIAANFPPPFFNMICDIPISQGEQDQFVWVPSTS